MIPWKKAFHFNLISPKGLFWLMHSLYKEGTNAMALLKFASNIQPANIALVEGEISWTYLELYQQSSSLAHTLGLKYTVQEGDSVVVIGRNSSSLVTSIFALSRLGVNIHFLHVEMSKNQIWEYVRIHSIDGILYDAELKPMLDGISLRFSCVLDNIHHDSIDRINASVTKKIARRKSGSFIVLSSGTKGKFSQSARNPSVFKFLYPLFALLTEVSIKKNSKIYLAVPISHGYGLATLITSVLLGLEQQLLRSFHAPESLELIERRGTDGLVVVPLMLRRILEQGRFPSSVSFILCGGARLDEDLIQKTNKYSNAELFNLYGTSEAGFCILANPSDLQKFPGSLGKSIPGVNVFLKGKNENGVGQLCIKHAWVREAERGKWVCTGDLVFINEQGYVFLKGRLDNRIVSGGENVYPEEVESILIQHPAIHHAHVFGVADSEFGQRLHAHVLLNEGSIVEGEEIRTWLKERVARYQMPALIEIKTVLPFTLTGKVISVNTTI